MITIVPAGTLVRSYLLVIESYVNKFNYHGAAGYRMLNNCRYSSVLLVLAVGLALNWFVGIWYLLLIPVLIPAGKRLLEEVAKE